MSARLEEDLRHYRASGAARPATRPRRQPIEADPISPALIPFAQSDVRAAMADYLAIRGGIRVEDPHPLARQLAHGRYKASIEEICGHLHGLSAASDRVKIQARLVSSDFGDDLEQAMAQVISVDYLRQSAENSMIVHDVPTKGTLPATLPTLDIGELQRTPRGGGPINIPLTLISDGVTIQPVVWSARFVVSRSLLINDEANLIVAATRQLVAHATRLEANQIAAVVNANAPLADGSPLIIAGNTASVTGVSVDAVGDALGLLRTNTTPAGNVANVRGRLWVVPPLREAAALEVARKISNGEDARLIVVVNSWLNGSDTYLLASPAESPAIIRSYPEGTSPAPTLDRVPAANFTENGDEEFYDGIAFRFEHIVGFSAADRIGIVKIPAS